MGTARYIYWQDGAHWLAYFEDFPDYLTQGESPEDLKEHLKDLYQDLTNGAVAGIRRAAELSVSS
jgi:predicted RNase H-like HicB family nuclease